MPYIVIFVIFQFSAANIVIFTKSILIYIRNINYMNLLIASMKASTEAVTISVFAENP